MPRPLYIVTLTIALGVALGAAVLTGCSGGNGGGGADTAPGDGWSGQTNIEAIFEASCSGCHAQQWSTCWDVQACATNVEGMVSSGAMPRNGSLSATDRRTLLAWLGQGAPCSGTRPAGTQACGGFGGGGAPIASEADTSSLSSRFAGSGSR